MFLGLFLAAERHYSLHLCGKYLNVKYLVNKEKRDANGGVFSAHITYKKRKYDSLRHGNLDEKC